MSELIDALKSLTNIDTRTEAYDPEHEFFLRNDIFERLAAADDEDMAFTTRQLDLISEVVIQLGAGIRAGIDMAEQADMPKEAVLTTSALDMIRNALLGVVSSPEFRNGLPRMRLAKVAAGEGTEV